MLHVLQGLMDHKFREVKSQIVVNAKVRALIVKEPPLMSNEKDADASPSVIEGTLSIYKSDVKVLIAPGTGHFFVSLMFERKLDVSSSWLLAATAGSTPMGYTLLDDKVHKSCVVVIEDKKFLVDLIVLEIHDLDVILGMGRLSTY